jgi:hypothetical protein
MQLSGLFPGNYYNSDESKALDFMGYFAHQRQQEEAFKNQELNRQAALQDIFHNEQMNPLKVQQQQGLLDRQSAELPGIQADSRKKTLDTDFAEQLQPEKIKLAIQQATTGLTQSELAGEMATINKALLNPKLSAQERKVLEMVRDNFPENYKLNRTIEGKKEVAAIPKPGRAGGTGSAKAPAPPKAPTDDIRLANYWQFQADNESDPETKAEHQIKADAARQRALALIQAKADAANAGKVDLGAMGGVPVRPGIAPQGQTPAPATKPAAAPTAPAGRVIIYKDGKAVGTIPESQRAQALKEGYLVK